MSSAETTLNSIASDLKELRRQMDAVYHQNLHITEGLEKLKKEIRQMASDLSAELQALSNATSANTAATTELGPAISRELQQVIDAVNAGASGAAAVAALEDARGKITTLTGTLTSNAAALHDAVTALAADDPSVTPPVPAP